MTNKQSVKEKNEEAMGFPKAKTNKDYETLLIEMLEREFLQDGRKRKR